MTSFAAKVLAFAAGFALMPAMLLAPRLARVSELPRFIPAVQAIRRPTFPSNRGVAVARRELIAGDAAASPAVNTSSSADWHQPSAAGTSSQSHAKVPEKPQNVRPSVPYLDRYQGGWMHDERVPTPDLHKSCPSKVIIGEFPDGPVTATWPHLRNHFVEGAKACPVPCVYNPDPDRGKDATIRISIWINSKKVQQAWLAAPDSQTRLLFTLEPWVPPRHLPIDMFVSFNHLADVRVSYVYTLTLKCKCESPKECEDQRYCTETQVASDVGTRRQDGAIGAFFVSNCGTGVSGRKRMQYLERMVNAGRQISPGKPLFHSYGKCLRTHSTSESKADVIDRYPFYISFESSELDGYVTEKFFEGFLLKRAIMVYLGPTDAPSHSPGVDAFIDARQLPSPEALVKFLNELARSPSRMREYHMWKQQPLREEFLRGAAQRNFLWHGPDSVPCRICKQFNATKCAHT